MENTQPKNRPGRSVPRAAIWAAIAVVSLVALAGATFGIARATDSPAFCRGACHEMRPFHASWTEGPHADVACVECHVDPGAIARLEHKFVALRELQVHVFGDPMFPKAVSAEVPNERCVRCHDHVNVDRPGFSHDQHASKGDCQACHADVGHDVSADQLRQAGIWSGEKPQPLLVHVGNGRANLPGHKRVDCSSCHDMAKTTCQTCHKPEHEDRGTCTTCHKPGAQFAFYHPSGKKAADCASCHDKPADHKRDLACTTCHTKPGKTWKFTHPTGGATCSTCHDLPAKHVETRLSCARCHATGGSSWKFRHPSGSSACGECHDKPKGHPSASGSCTRCHSTGSSWAFRHPSGSTSCRSCHSAPSNHYGASCASCHSPSRSWSSASFNHPGIRGGEHSYRSFSCSSCHPSGYSSATCTKCHSSSSGPKDD